LLWKRNDSQQSLLQNQMKARLNKNLLVSGKATPLLNNSKQKTTRARPTLSGFRPPNS